jgi:uncharacterized phage infection (PIP) family protein YhgE
MSLVFMTLVVMVYQVHRNWRDVVMRPEKDAVGGKEPGLKFQLEKARIEVNEAKDKLEKLTNAINEEKKDKRETLAKLENQLDTLQKEKDALDKDLAKETQTARDTTSALQSTQTNLTAKMTELDKLREEIRVTQKDRDDQMRRVVDLTDQLHQAVASKMTLKATNEQLAQQMARANEVLRHFGHSIETPLTNEPPVPVDGLVTAVRDDNKLVEISLGTDMGVLRGHRLEVARNVGGTSKYLGKIEVIEARKTDAVAKVLPEYRQGAIQRGDRVFSVPKLTNNN